MGKRVKWSLELLCAEALKYSTRNEFYKNSTSAYSSACRRGLIDEVCGHMVTGIKTKWTEVAITIEASKYNKRGKFKKGCRNAYNAARRCGVLDKVCSHMIPSTLNMLFTSLRNVPGVYELIHNNEIVYIGKATKHLSGRLGVHVSDPTKVFDTVVAYEIHNESDIHIAELYLINKLKPKYNINDVGLDMPTLVINNIDSVIINVTTILLKDKGQI